MKTPNPTAEEAIESVEAVSGLVASLRGKLSEIENALVQIEKNQMKIRRYVKNPGFSDEERKQKARDYYNQNKEKRREYSRKYYQEHKEAIKETARKWRKENWTYVKAQNRKNYMKGKKADQ